MRKFTTLILTLLMLTLAFPFVGWAQGFIPVGEVGSCNKPTIVYFNLEDEYLADVENSFVAKVLSNGYLDSMCQVYYEIYYEDNLINRLSDYGSLRSNVGKSSLINMLTSNSKLAKTSSSPGKTQKINHFVINNSWYLVDLPGYGYAKVSKSQRAVFKNMIDGYILNRQNLVNLFVLVDSRLEPQAIDVEFINWLGVSRVPFTIIFTKSDKLGTGC